MNLDKKLYAILGLFLALMLVLELTVLLPRLKAACVAPLEKNREYITGKLESSMNWMTISCSVAAYPDDAATANDLTAVSDGALYRAKRTGRNRVETA